LVVGVDDYDASKHGSDYFYVKPYRWSLALTGAIENSKPTMQSESDESVVKFAKRGKKPNKQLSKADFLGSPHEKENEEDPANHEEIIKSSKSREIYIILL
jgi:hypothetical protein